MQPRTYIGNAQKMILFIILVACCKELYMATLRKHLTVAFTTAILGVCVCVAKEHTVPGVSKMWSFSEGPFSVSTVAS